MSAAKRTSVRRKKTATKTTAKVAAKSRAAGTRSVARAAKKTPKKTTKKVTKKISKKVTKKVTKRVAKKTAKKVTTKVVKRVVKRPKNAAPQSVREARYGGHQGTLPTNPKAPGRLLGRSVALSVLGLSSVPVNTDALAVGVARLGGLAIMVAGVALSWNLFNIIAMPAPTPQTASVLESQHPAPLTVSVAAAQPVSGETTTVITAADATNVILGAETADGTLTVLGEASQRTDTTWEYALDTTTVTDGEYSLVAFIQRAGYDTAERVATPLSVQNQVTVPVATTTVATTTATSSLEVVTADVVERAPTTTMPTLRAPTVSLIVAETPTTARLIGTATPSQQVEVLLLRADFRATTSVQTNGWWTYTLPTPSASDDYELFARATPELLSRPLDFTVIAGRLRTQPPTGDTQMTSVSDSSPTTESQLWYLLAAVTTVAVGAVVLLIGHHLHHTRRRPESETKLDPAS